MSKAKSGKEDNSRKVLLSENSEAEERQENDITSPLQQKENPVMKDKSRVSVENEKEHVTLHDYSENTDSADTERNGNNSRKYYQSSQQKNKACQFDTDEPNSFTDYDTSSTLEAYEHLRDNAQKKLDNINAAIMEHDNHFQTVIQPKMNERTSKNLYVTNKLRIERSVDITTNNETGEQVKKVRHNIKIEKEIVPASKRYRILSHKSGSGTLSAIAQETAQWADITLNKGVLHGADAVIDKLPVPKAVKKSDTVKAVRAVALGTETVVKEIGDNAAENISMLAKRKVEEYVDTSENDAVKTASYAGVALSDIVSDVRTTAAHVSKETANRRERANDRDNEKYEWKREKLEYKKEKAEYELNAAQKKIDNLNKTDTDELHDIERVEPHDKTQIKLDDKSRVTPSDEKKRTDTRISDEKSGLIEKAINSHKEIKDEAAKPHKYTIKRRCYIDPETGKKKSKILIERKILSTNEKDNGFVRNSVREAERLLHGEFDLPNKKDPNLFQELSGISAKRTAMRGANKLRSKAVRDGGDNDAVTAIDGTARALSATGRAYDTTKSCALIARDSMRSFLQPLDEGLTNGLISGERKVMQYFSDKSESKSQLQPKSENAKKDRRTDQKNNSKKNKQKQYNANRKKVFQVFKDKETRRQAAYELIKLGGEKAKKYVVGAAAIAIMIFAMPIMFLGAGGGTSGAVSTIAAVVSPTSDLDLTKSENYWTELAENMIKDFKDFLSTHDGDKYTVSGSSINHLDHDTYKLLAYLSVKCKDEDTNMWDFDGAKGEIESIFNEQFELFNEESNRTVYEVVNVENSYTSPEYPVGGSIWNNPYFDSANYAGHADTKYEILIDWWYENYTVDNVYIDNGEKLSEPQSITYSNYKYLYLEYPDKPATKEYWKLVYREQELHDKNYKSYEYGIRENKTFDQIIDERVASFDDEQKQFYDFYREFYLGHYSYKAPVNPFNIIDYAGYNVDVDGTDGLDNSITVSTNYGNEIAAPCNGVLTKTGDNKCSIYCSSNKSTIYIENISVSVDGSVTKNNVIGSASGDSIKILIVDKDGNYLNPYLYIEWW